MRSHSYPTEWLFVGCLLAGLLTARVTNPLMAAIPAVAAGVAQYVAIARRRERPRLVLSDTLRPWLAVAAAVGLVLARVVAPRSADLGFSTVVIFVGHLAYSAAAIALAEQATPLPRGEAWVSAASSPVGYWLWVGLFASLSLAATVGIVALIGSL